MHGKRFFKGTWALGKMHRGAEVDAHKGDTGRGLFFTSPPCWRTLPGSQ